MVFFIIIYIEDLWPHFLCHLSSRQRTMISILDRRNLRTNPNLVIAIVLLIVLAIYRSHRQPRTTRLRGPPSKSFFFGVAKDIFNSLDLSGMYGTWEKTYGPVYEIPSSLGSTILVLQDPKAITDLFSKDTTTYHQSRLSKSFFKNVLRVSFFNRSGQLIPIGRLVVLGQRYAFDYGRGDT